jgi:hypothetical protein
MSVSRFPSLQTRIDDFSYQISDAADPRFWFRLERRADHDVISDYFLGSHPNERGGDLLVECYRVLGLTPRKTIVFRDIVPSSSSAAHSQAVAAARDLYAACGKALLMRFGARRVQERFEEEEGGKYQLVLVDES